MSNVKEIRDESTDAMLSKSNGVSKISSKKQKKQTKAEEQESEALQTFLRSISSTATLPGYVKGDNYSSSRGVINQCLVCGAVLVLAAAAGHPIGFSAVALPQMANETGPMHADVEMGSWIASIHSAATPLGSMVSGPIMEALGRRKALQATAAPLILGWILISTAAHQAQLLVGRVVCGLAVGTMAAPSQVYLGEISEPKLRGLLIGTPFVAYSLGVLYVYVLGGALDWRMVALLSIVLPVLSAVALFLSPESPTWLARRGDFNSASASIAKLRGDETIARRELHELIAAREKEKARGEEKVPFFATIRRLPVLKPLILINSFNILQIFSGTYIVIFYAVDILKETGGSFLDPTMAAIVSAVVRLLFTVISCFLLLKLPRRTLAIASGVGTSATTIALAIVLARGQSESQGYIGAVLVLLYIAFNTLGFMVLPGLMIGELLPAKIRGLCGGYIFCLFNLILFGFTKLFPMIKDTLGMAGVFGLFGSSAVAATLLLYLMLPETKGRSLLQIEQYYEKPNIFWVTRHKMMADSERV